ncbi:Hint domain-containing protein [Paracoccus isoporae]|uniref:Hint domain-containing protein n=2 Tax=Paracoccus isoporae TaxID=591205 RepID=A0A1G6X0K7_9RHOB|nr:Hint domain-containing protein [Paracoccus isoporae]
MPYITEAPASLVTLDPLLDPIVNTGDIGVLNQFGTSQESTGPLTSKPNAGQIDVADPGETVTFPTASGDIEAEYVGAVTLANLDATVLALITVQLNPIEGHVLQAGDGTTYFVTDQPLDQGNLTVKVQIPLLGIDADLTLTELLNIDLGILEINLSGIVTDLLNTAILTATPSDGDLAVQCFTSGTLIDTPDGPVAVEALRIGDLVVTCDNGPQPIRWIGSVTLSAAQLALAPHLRPIRICRGALGPDMPSADLVVSPQHRILVRSRIAVRMFGTEEILVAAKQLLQLDGVEVARDLDEVEYVHFMCDQHECVISNGAVTESLYAGPVALRTLRPAELAELKQLMPQIFEDGHEAEPARVLTPGRKSRKLVQRHLDNGQHLVS